MAFKPMTPTQKRLSRAQLQERRAMLEALIHSAEYRVREQAKLTAEAEAELSKAKAVYTAAMKQISDAPKQILDLTAQIIQLEREDKQLDHMSDLEKYHLIKQRIQDLEMPEGNTYVDEEGVFHCPKGHKHTRGPSDGRHTYKCYQCPNGKWEPTEYSVTIDLRVKHA
jgi:hypothetical protein